MRLKPYILATGTESDFTVAAGAENPAGQIAWSFDRARALELGLRLAGCA